MASREVIEKPAYHPARARANLFTEGRTMRAGILGSGDVGKSLARGFLQEGHEAMLGSREPGKLAGWVRESGNGASSGTFAETAKFGEVVVMAVNGANSVDAIEIG